MAASEIQPACGPGARHRIAIAAEAWRPSGYLAIWALAHSRFSGENAKVAGCTSLGARRRTDISLSLSLRAARDVGVQGVDPVLPERACRAEYVIADVGGNLDAIEDRQFGHGFEATAAGIVHDQLQRGLFENITRHRVLRIVAVLLAQDHAVALQQPRAALDGLDLDPLDIELDQIFAAGRHLAVIEEVVEREHRHLFGIVGLFAGDAERFVLGAGQPRGAAG